VPTSAEASEKGPVRAPPVEPGGRPDQERHPAVPSRVRQAQLPHPGGSVDKGGRRGRHVGRILEVADLASQGLGFDVVDVDPDDEHVGVVGLELPLEAFAEEAAVATDLRGEPSGEAGLVLVDGRNERDEVGGLERAGALDPLALGHGRQMKTVPRV